MSKGKGSILTGLLVAFGVLLILSAVAGIVLSGAYAKNAEKKAQAIVSELYSLMPDVKDAAPDDRVETSMSVIEVDGEDFAGIIEIPAYGTKLPVYAAWDKTKTFEFPCRYSGSVYEESLIIGGSDNEGQFDFMKLITGGDRIFLSETSGLRYEYTVTDILKTKDVSNEWLTAQDADLLLFARNTYSFDYTVVCCDLASGN